MPDPAKLTLADTVGVVCEICASPTFKEVFYIRKISKFLAGTPRDVIQTIPVLQCSKCDHINDEINPLNSINEGSV